MKRFVSIALCLFLMMNLSQQIPRLVNCPANFLDDHPRAADTCGTLTCQDDGLTVGIGCGTWDCLPEKRMGYKVTDNSKPFPYCCGGLICAD